MEAEARAYILTIWRRRLSLSFLPRLRKFQSRLLLLFSGLMGLVLIAVLVSVNNANLRSARIQIEQSLNTSEKVFNRLLETRNRQLAEGANLLSSDFAFKRAIFTWDHDTILSALENLGGRINADALMLVSLEHTLLADTTRPQARDEDFFAPELIETAEEEGAAFSFATLGAETHQIVAAPLLAPDPMAWICVSFEIDQTFVDQLRQLTSTHISLFRRNTKEGYDHVATTLPDPLQSALAQNIADIKINDKGSRSITLDGDEYVTRSTAVFTNQRISVIAVLQRSLEEALRPFYRLRTLLIVISVIALGITVLGCILAAKNVTQPVLTLVRGVRETAKGNYGHKIVIDQQDELGELSDAYNKMSLGLKERDNVRNLLGKVMSPTVAHELLSKEIKLGGEERYMTALFSDVEGFTQISEKLAPVALVALLNEYLSAMADIINESNGVIDKFIGDAIVSFWGAPLAEERHAELAVRTALRMQKKLENMQDSWDVNGHVKINARIGVNTGPMVVGNMGSKDRMDYTMIGDSVNLAARLEGINKYYGTNLMVSEYTYKLTSDLFICRELDIVRVKGKTEAITIYEVIDEIENQPEQTTEFIKLFGAALSVYRAKDFDKAKRLFENCDELKDGGDAASRLYLERINRLVENPPAPDWDGVHDLDK